MRKWETVFTQWDTYKQLEPSVRTELDQLKQDENKLEDAFYKELTFGTGGMRGILGPGINRMNIYTIRKTVKGLAEYLLVHCVNVKDRGVVVAYDSRYMSKTFAIETARVLGVYGIKTYICESLRPTPLLSFAIRYLGTAAGVMITASHNPPEYNGFKVYNEDGGQMVPEEADQVIAAIQAIENELEIPVLEQAQLEEEELLIWVGKEVDSAYLEQLAQITNLDEAERAAEKDLGIVFTPLHGTAEQLVIQGLEQLNFTNVHLVEEQAVPDSEFSTVASPNPEEHQAFEYSIRLGKEKQADILLATDPDADRLGVAVKNEQGEYTVLTGNQLGSLLLDYILTYTDADVFKNARMVKSIVTTELGRAIAESYGVESMDVLTGFKYIAEKIRQFDTTGETFIFGYEESYGYLIRTFARDKDAVQAAVMACEMAYYWKKQGKTLLDALEVIYEKHGYYLEGMTSLTLDGIAGTKQIATIMETFRDQPLTEIAGFKVQVAEDYLRSERHLLQTREKQVIDLPKENVLKFKLADHGWVCLRPSGTEPKIKCYYGVCGTDAVDSKQRLAALKEEMDGRIQAIIGN